MFLLTIAKWDETCRAPKETALLLKLEEWNKGDCSRGSRLYTIHLFQQT